jgi:hypothetical protein
MVGATAIDPVSIVIEEKVVCSMTRDGACDSMEVKGTLALTIHNPDATRCRVILRRGDTSGYQFQNHPNVNKPLFTSDAVLALKQADREFPTGLLLEHVAMFLLDSRSCC